MAKKYEYGIRLGASVDESQIKLSMQKVSNFLAKDTNMQKIKLKFDDNAIQKDLVNIRKLFDNITGKEIGSAYTLQIGEQFIEVEQNIKGVVKNIEILDNSIKRLGGETDGISNTVKRIESFKETIRQISDSSVKFVNAEDIAVLDDMINQSEVLNNQIEENKVIQGEIKSAISETLDNLKLYNSENEETLKNSKEKIVILENTKKIENEIQSLGKQNEKIEKNNLSLKEKSEKLSQNNLVNEKKKAQYEKELLDLTKQREDILSKINSSSSGGSKNTDDVNDLLAAMGVKSKSSTNDAKEQVVENEKLSKSLDSINSKIEKKQNLLDNVSNKISDNNKAVELNTNKIDTNNQSLEKNNNKIEENRETLKSNISTLEEQKQIISDIENGSKVYTDTLLTLNTQLAKNQDETAELVSEQGGLFNSIELGIKKTNNASQNYKSTLKDLTTDLNKLFVEEQRLQKLRLTAEAKGNTKDVEQLNKKISLLKQEEAIVKRNITNLTGSSVLQKELTAEHTKKLKLQEQSYLISQKNSTIQKEQTQQINEYIRRYKEYTDLQLALFSAEQKLNNSDKDVTNSDLEHINYLQEQIRYTKEFLDLKEQENDTLLENSRVKESVEQQDRRLETTKSKLLTQYDEEVVSLNSIGKSINSAIFSYNMLDRAIDAVVDSIRYSVTQILELNQAMVDIQMITGSSNAESAKLAQTYSDMAQNLGATTAEVAASSSEWLLIRSCKTPLTVWKTLRDLLTTA